MSAKNMIAFDLGKEDNLLPIQSIGIGFGAKAELKKVKKRIKKRSPEACQFIIGTITEILERSPIINLCSLVYETNIIDC